MPEPKREDELRKADRPPEPPPPTIKAANWGLAFDLGLRLGISVILGLGLGILADNWLHTTPIFILIGMVLGIGAAMYTIWDVARESMKG
ncbi:MAG TPA: AtpZ/AtpI family protein [Candidatus Saccharimonadales bacterium]|jgi:F0F1-type ATP synthase assembly protein I|nr:AtpZ/AtpI family protein [Candidatus Saccharimonadales bacterium]